jgi:hypothetical protein
MASSRLTFSAAEISFFLGRSERVLVTCEYARPMLEVPDFGRLAPAIYRDILKIVLTRLRSPEAPSPTRILPALPTIATLSLSPGAPSPSSWTRFLPRSVAHRRPCRRFRTTFFVGLRLVTRRLPPFFVLTAIRQDVIKIRRFVVARKEDRRCRRVNGLAYGWCWAEGSAREPSCCP